MKYTFAFFFGLLIASQCAAQLGFNAGYKTFNAPNWEEWVELSLNESPYPNAGWQVGVDYWFRLKKRRIEFMPEISFSNYKHSFTGGEMKMKQFGLHFNTAVYIFDLASDCNCPTFSKDGNVLGKGFFLELSPGLTFLSHDFSDNSVLGAYYPGKSLGFGGSLGAGLDLGFSDLFTITPLARFYYYPSLNAVDDLQPAGVEPTELTQIFVGLRFRLHFKEMDKARYR